MREYSLKFNFIKRGVKMENIKEFIYLDTEKVKSILSQLEEGLPISANETTKIDSEFGGTFGTGFLNWLKAETSSNILSSNQNDETKILHDYMYNYIEKELTDNEKLLKLHSATKQNNKLPKDLNENSFVLLECKIKINDYNQILSILENMNDLNVALQVLSINANPLQNGVWENVETELKVRSQLLNEDFVKSAKLFIEHFYKNKLIITCFPYEKNNFLSFNGPLKREYLRDDINDIIFKYGRSPSVKWYVFGKISSIENPHKKTESADKKYERIMENWDEILNIINNTDSYNDLKEESLKKWRGLGLNEEDFIIIKEKAFEVGIENIYDTMDLLYYEASIKEPSITFTPIAIYRQ